MDVAQPLQQKSSIQFCCASRFRTFLKQTQVEKFEMKSLYAVAAIVALSAVPTFASEGHVTTNSLAKMGLAGMKSMDDAQGMNIRGLSIAVVSGGGIAGIHGHGGAAAAVDTYFASG